MYQISMEFFPPRTAEMHKRLNECLEKFARFNPTFYSVTFGAGGSNTAQTEKTLYHILEKSDIPIAPHLTCIGLTQTEIISMLEHYQQMKLHRIVVLRGDLPSEKHKTHDFKHASELVSFIREKFDDYFEITVAAYPECHPESASLETDFEFFKHKVACGANNALTQYFYDFSQYEKLINLCEHKNVKIPVTPGIMPITNYTQLKRFSDSCGTTIPNEITKKLEHYANLKDTLSLKAYGTHVVLELCQKLIQFGVPGLHFYCLNQHTPVTNILEQL